MNSEKRSIVLELTLTADAVQTLVFYGLLLAGVLVMAVEGELVYQLVTAVVISYIIKGALG